MKKRFLLTTLIIGIAIVSAILLLRDGFQDKVETAQNSRQKKPPKVKVVSASKAPISLTLELTGSVEPYRIARLASPAEGPVLDIRRREGDRVQAGDPLLSIGRKKGIDMLIASLREELRKEKENLNRTLQLVKSGALPGEQLNQARVLFEKVHAQLVKTEEMSLDYSIIAPWQGIVSRLLVKEGEFVSPRTPLLEMYDPSSLTIRSAIPEKYAAELEPNMRVDVRLDAYPNKIMEGRIERLYPYLDNRLRTRTMEIVLEEPLYLLPGMFARLKVLLKRVNDTVVVPTEAIRFTSKGKAVFVVEGGKAVKRSVKIGIEEGDRMQIVSGIDVGDRIILAGNERLKDGTVVKIAGGKSPGKNHFVDISNRPGKQDGKSKARGPQE